jgi:hypothetical protein
MQIGSSVCAVLLFSASLLRGVTVGAQQCAEADHDDEVSFMQIGAADVQQRKTSSKLSREDSTDKTDKVHPIPHTAHLILHGSEEGARHTYPMKQEERKANVDEQAIQEAKAQLEAEAEAELSAEADLDAETARHASVLSGIVTGILSSAREKLDAISVFLAHETEEMAIKMNQYQPKGPTQAVPLTPEQQAQQRMNRKSEKVVDYLTDAIKFLMTLLISVLILAFLVLCVVGCVLLINWRIVDEDGPVSRIAYSEDDIAHHRPNSNNRFTSAGAYHHQPFQGQAHRLTPDSPIKAKGDGDSQ